MANKLPSADQVSTLTTFVQADPSTFRALVQKLTGADDSSPHPKLPISTVSTRQPYKHVLGDMGPRKPAFKLQERRQQNLRKLEINLGPTSRHGRNPIKGENEMMLVSPVSTLDRLFSSYSPRTPTSPSGSSSPSCWESEERAIAGKGFYLHPAVVNTPRSSEPELLPLFPLHSPRQNPSAT